MIKFSIITPTHNPEYLHEAYQSLKAQTYPHWEWCIFANHKSGLRERVRQVGSRAREIVGSDSRVSVDYGFDDYRGVGQVKKDAFSCGKGDVLVELDHDDLLTTNCLAELAEVFANSEVGFVYSDWVDFEHEAKEFQGLPTYRKKDVREAWARNGFTFDMEVVDATVRKGSYECVRSFEPTALALSLIYWSPNHVRAWRRDVYEQIGGHDASFKLCDDHELLVRTFCATKMKRIPKTLYLYRVHRSNTYSKDIALIETLTRQIEQEWKEKLILRECELRGLHAFEVFRPENLSREILSTPASHRAKTRGWTPIDFAEIVVVPHWTDHYAGKVGAFKLTDSLQHYDKELAMSRIWRDLAPGGHVIGSVPSTDGRGAFMDPRHVSYWNENSFWYWTRRSLWNELHTPSEKQKLMNRFQEVSLKTRFPSDWHEQNKIPYVDFHLVALKDGYKGPGEVLL